MSFVQFLAKQETEVLKGKLTLLRIMSKCNMFNAEQLLYCNYTVVEGWIGGIGVALC